MYYSQMQFQKFTTANKITNYGFYTFRAEYLNSYWTTLKTIIFFGNFNKIQKTFNVVYISYYEIMTFLKYSTLVCWPNIESYIRVDRWSCVYSVDNK